jgi:hypothetical protein
MNMITIVGLALSFAEKLMDKLPNYSQRKKEEFHALKKTYWKLVATQPQDRDDNLLEITYQKILSFLQDFQKEIQQ